jgi:hypothetical protein
MEPVPDYTPEGKNKVEIDKLYAEVAELRSRVRRWIGSLGGLLGIVTAAVSVIVTSQQWSRAANETAMEKNQLAAERSSLTADRAKFDADRAKIDLEKATAKKEAAETQERETNNRVKEAEVHFVDLQSQAGAAQAALAEKVAQLDTKSSELEKLQNAIDALATSLKRQPATQREAETALAVSNSTRNLIASEHRKLVEDNSKPRLFFFVLNSLQRENAWKLEPKLLSSGFYIGNVIVFGGKRDETPALRYFRDADKAEAEKLRDTLISLGLEKVHLSRVNDPDSAGTGRKFQIWVRKEDFN